MSLQRIPNGTDTNRNSDDFTLSNPTPGTQNEARGQQRPTQSTVANSNSNTARSSSDPPAQKTAATIILSEVYPNPIGLDTEGEWIELQNNEMSSVDLTGWVLEDASGNAFLVSKSLPNTEIAPNGFYTLDYSQTKITLNNDTDTIVLKRPDGSIVERISYSDLAEGQSFARFENIWKATDMPTKNASNVLMSTDKEQGTENKKSKSTNDEQNSNTTSAKLLNDSPPTTANTSVSVNQVIATATSLKGKIRLSEVMPNPIGDDDELEWIEIENVSDEALKLEGLKLKDKTSENALPVKIIAAKEFVVFQKPEFTLTINNGDELLELFDATNEFIDNVSYVDAKEGISYSRVGTGWKWTDPSKGTKNNSGVVEQLDRAAEDANQKKSSSAKKSVSNTLTVTGTVLVRPNVFGKTMIYISGEEGNHQIYFQKGDWPELADGDIIEVHGQTSAAGDVPRIKIQSPAQIVVQSEASGLEPTERTIEELSEDDIGGLFRVSGEMLESNGSSLTIGDETGELEVYFKSSEIKKPMFQQGRPVVVTGILVESSKGFRLLPRYPEDIEFPSSSVLGDSSELPKQSPANHWKVIGGIALLSGVLGYAFRKKIIEHYRTWKSSSEPVDDSFEE